MFKLSLIDKLIGVNESASPRISVNLEKNPFGHGFPELSVSFSIHKWGVSERLLTGVQMSLLRVNFEIALSFRFMTLWTDDSNC